MVEQRPHETVVKGTRLTVELIMRQLAGGMSVAEILEAHPRLTPEDIEAAQAFAADQEILNQPSP